MVLRHVEIPTAREMEVYDAWYSMEHGWVVLDFSVVHFYKAGLISLVCFLDFAEEEAV